MILRGIPYRYIYLKLRLWITTEDSMGKCREYMDLRRDARLQSLSGLYENCNS